MSSYLREIKTARIDATQLTVELTDGFTFTIQNVGPNALGAAGGSLGYQGIRHSVAIKFDIYPNLSSTGLYLDGVQPGEDEILFETLVGMGHVLRKRFAREPPPGNAQRAQRLTCQRMVCEQGQVLPDRTAGACADQQEQKLAS